MAQAINCRRALAQEQHTTVKREWARLLGALAAAALLLLLPAEAWALPFTGGPSVRVTPNVQVEFRWITDYAWYGKVEVFDNPDGTGTPVTGKQALDLGGLPLAATQQVVTIPVAGPFAPDTVYFFKVTATDPNQLNEDIVTPTPLPPLFTGAQVLSNVSVQSITTNSATIAWESNVIGLGKVAFGTSSFDQTVQDAFNITNHALELTGLQPGTTYQFRVSNRHAIDGDDLASTTGQFTTAAVTPTVVFTGPHAEPRVIQVGQISTVSIQARNRGNPVPGIVVAFSIDPSSSGAGTLSGLQVATDSTGVARVQLMAIRSGLVYVTVNSAQAFNSLTIPVVIR